MKLLLTTLLTTAAMAGPILDEGFEDRAVGERCGWNDHSTIRGDSFAGVTGVTASPFAGGLHAYTFHRAADQNNGWALLGFPEPITGPILLRLDFMVPRGGGGSFELHTGARGVYVGLHLSPTELAVRTGHRREQSVSAIEPHVWYLAELRIPGPGAETFTLALRRQGKAASHVFPDVPACQTGERFGRLKISAASGQRFYFDNLRLELAPEPSMTDNAADAAERKEPAQ